MASPIAALVSLSLLAGADDWHTVPIERLGGLLKEIMDDEVGHAVPGICSKYEYWEEKA